MRHATQECGGVGGCFDVLERFEGVLIRQRLRVILIQQRGATRVVRMTPRRAASAASRRSAALGGARLDDDCRDCVACCLLSVVLLSCLSVPPFGAALRQLFFVRLGAFLAAFRFLRPSFLRLLLVSCSFPLSFLLLFLLSCSFSRMMFAVCLFVFLLSCSFSHLHLV